MLLGARPRRFELLTCLVIVGMASGGTMMLFTIPAALAAFLTLSLVPPWLLVVVRPEYMPSLFFAYTTVYAGFMLVSARYSYETFVENVRLRLAKCRPRL